MVTKYFSTDLSSQVGKQEKIPIDQALTLQRLDHHPTDRDHQWSVHKTKFPTIVATNGKRLY